MAETYSTKDISVIDDTIEYIRMRPNLYLTNDPMNVAFREIFDNAFDEVTNGNATTVTITIHGDGSYEVEDDGRGVPVDFDKTRSMNGIVMTLGTPMSGGKFRAQGKEKSGYSGTKGISGTNGIGASGTNAISQRFSVVSYRGGKMYTQDFSQGRPGTFKGTSYDAEAPFTRSMKGTPLKGKKSDRPAGHTGTRVRFTFDDSVVTGTTLNLDDVLFRAKCSAALIPGSTLHINHADGTTETVTGTDNGTSDIMKTVLGASPILVISGSTEFEEKGLKKGVDWNASIHVSHDSSSYGFVNKVYTQNGGSHITAMYKAIGEIMEERASGMKSFLKLRKGENTPSADNFASTASVVISIDSSEIAFDGQEKSSFKSGAFHNALYKDVIDKLGSWAKSKNNIESVRMWAGLARDKNREERSIDMAKKRNRTTPKNVGETLLLPAKYLPCMGQRGDGTELWITEGDSAMSTVSSARDSDFQAAIPVRGKILNVYNMAPDRAYKRNAEVRDIINVLGGGFGKNFKPEECKFDKIFMATDADYDGYHINILGMLLFYEMTPGLIESGLLWRVYPPLFIVTSPNKDVRRYAVDKGDRDRIIVEMKEAGIKNPQVQRCKGLGEMNAQDFWDSVMNPETRIAKKVTIEDIDEAKNVLETLFPMKKNEHSSNRKKEWYSQVLGRLDVEEMDI